MLLDPARRRRLRHVLDVRRTGADAAPRQARQERADLQPVPHHGAVQPDPRRLLTGRNHHSCGTGVIIEMGTGFPGYTGIIPQEHVRRGRRRCATTATPRRCSASRTTRRSRRSARPARSTTGRPVRASTTSTASIRAKRTSTFRRSIATRIRWLSRSRRSRATTSRKT